MEGEEGRGLVRVRVGFNLVHKRYEKDDIWRIVHQLEFTFDVLPRNFRVVWTPLYSYRSLQM